MQKSIMINRYKIFFYVLFTFLLTFISGTIFFSQQLNEALPKGLLIVLKVIFIPGIIAPFFIAMLMKYFENRWEGVKDLLRLFINKKTSFYWYILAFALPLVVHLGASLIDTLRGQPFGQPFAYADQSLIFTALQIFFLAGIAEELGWRGYLQPLLQKRMGSAPLSIIIGLIVAIWHLPLFLQGNDIHSGNSFMQFILLMIAVAFIYTWLMDNTQSVLILALFHTSHDIASINFSQADYLSCTIIYAFIAIIIVSVCGLKRFKSAGLETL